MAVVLPLYSPPALRRTPVALRRPPPRAALIEARPVPAVRSDGRGDEYAIQLVETTASSAPLSLASRDRSERSQSETYPHNTSESKTSSIIDHGYGNHKNGLSQRSMRHLSPKIPPARRAQQQWSS